MCASVRVRANVRVVCVCARMLLCAVALVCERKYLTVCAHELHSASGRCGSEHVRADAYRIGERVV